MEKLPPSGNENLTVTPWDSLSEVKAPVTRSDRLTAAYVDSKGKLIYEKTPPISKTNDEPIAEPLDRSTTYYYDGKFMHGKEWVDTVKQDMAKRRQEGKSVKVSDLPLDPINAPK